MRRQIEVLDIPAHERTPLVEGLVKLIEALAERIQQQEEHVFVFLHCPDVPPDNNACERALRPSVIHRKVTNGFRSEWGAHAYVYAALATAIETAKLQNRNVFATLVNLMGPPVLPFLAS